MTYVVTDKCVKCKYTDCVEVCPVDCFKEGPNFLVIDPETCIDCNLCLPACPIDAIFAEEDVPKTMLPYIQINIDLAKKWPTISKRIDPLPDADDWAKVPNKLSLLVE